MPTLAEVAASLAPEKFTVKLGDTSLDIRGLTSGEISEIAIRFPEFGEFLNQARSGSEGEAVPADGAIPDDMAERIARKVDMATVLAMAGTAWPAVIAAAVSQPGDPETEAIARGFAFGYQQTLVNEIFRLSFPQNRPLANGGEKS